MASSYESYPEAARDLLVFDLKAEGNKLKGTLSGPILPAPASIKEGAIEGDRVSFSVTMAIMPGMPPVLIGYSGTVKGDEMLLSAALDMGQGQMTIPVAATRVKERLRFACRFWSAPSFGRSKLPEQHAAPRPP